MKKIYFVASTLFVGLAFGQQNTDGPSPVSVEQNLRKTEFLNRNLENAGSRPAGQPIYCETFADPFNSGWTTTGTGSSGGTYQPDDLWLQDFDGPNGGFSSLTERIQSATVGDGFLMLDGDFFNGGGGPPGVVESFHAEVVSPVYNLTGQTDVSISFDHMYRWCCYSAPTPFWVEVSTDGFANVAASYDVTYADAGVNIGSGTRTVYINITNDITANPANVQVRFRWGAAGEPNNPSHYYWQIDDFCVIESFDYHGRIDSLNYYADYLNFNPTFTSGASYPVGFQKIPDYASGQTTMSVEAWMTNMGAMDWTGAALQVDQNGSSFATSSTQNVLAGNQSNLFLAENLLPNNVGMYNYQCYGVSSSPFQIMDTLDFDIEVTEWEWSNAGSTPTGFISIQDWNWNTVPQSGGCGAELIIPNLVSASALPPIIGFQARLRDTSYNEYVPIECQLYINGSLAHSEGFTVDPNYFGGYQEFLFSQTVQINPGDTILYYIVSDYQLDPNHSLDFISSGTDALHLGLVVTYDAQGDVLANFLVEPAMIDLMTGYAGIEEMESNISSLGQNRPNPFDNNTTINFSLVSNEMVTFTITDVAGKVVKTMDLGSRGAGEHQIQLNAADFNKGIYFYTLKAGDSRLTKKMIVTK